MNTSKNRKFFTKAKVKWCAFVLAALALSFLLFAAIINSVMISQAEDYTLTSSQLENYGADCVLVLGARVYSDGRPSLILQDRLSRGVELYKNGAGNKLLLSGDHGTILYDEVNAMKSYALGSDVPMEDIFLDHAGFSTYESLYRAKVVFGVQKVVIVTQRFHSYRALYIAKKLGLEAYVVSSDIHDYYRYTKIKNNLREFIARAKDWCYVQFWPLPRYLGELIDIHGSGEATFD